MKKAANILEATKGRGAIIVEQNSTVEILKKLDIKSPVVALQQFQQRIYVHLMCPYCPKKYITNVRFRIGAKNTMKGGHIEPL